MIKVNLLRNRGSGKSANETQTFVADESVQFTVESTETEGANPVVKVLVMLLWTVGLIVWEQYNIGQLDKQISSLSAQSQQITSDIAALQPDLAQAEKTNKDYAAFKNKVDLVKKLGRLRLREIRALDHLQNIIPEKAWFTNISFVEDKFLVEGVAANDQILDNLIEGIRRHTGFKDVLLAKAIEEKTGQGNLRIFLITSTMAGGS